MRLSARNALLALVLAALCCAAIPAAAGATITLPAGFQQRTVLSGLVQPTAVRFAPNGSSLVFVAEKRGTIQVFNGLTDTTPDQVINLRREVYNNGDRGLLGLAVDPGFPDRPYIYALYARDATFAASTGAAAEDVPLHQPTGTADTADDDPDCGGQLYGALGCPVSGRLVRIEVNPVSGVMVPGTAPNPKPLLSGWCQQFSSHSLGDLRFGPDGQLYVSGGEGANYDNPDLGQFSDPCPDGAGEAGALRAQDASTPGDAAGTTDPTNLNGAVLRIDPDTGAASAGNPFTTGDAGQRRIIGYGLRNPYRMTFRPGTTQSDLWLGDVGWGRWEEINRIPDATPPVRNFGWPCYEGDWQGNNPQADYQNASPALCNAFYAVDGAGITPPFFSYYHTTYEEDPSYSGPCYPTQDLSNYNAAPLTGSAITGLAFYDGGDYPASYNSGLFFGDYARGCLWFMGAGSDGLPDRTNVQRFASWNPDTDIGLVSLERGPGGDIFIVDIVSGSVRRLRYGAVDARVTALDPTSGPNPLTVHLSAAASASAGATITKYEWDLDGDGTFETNTGSSPLATATFPSAGVTNVKVRVTDSLGRTGDSDALKIEAGKKPVVAIDSPSDTAAPWTVGDQLAFHGSAYDGAGQTIADANMTWDLVLRHCPGGTSCHSHFIAGNLSTRHGPGGTFIAPDHSYPSHLELSLTATDADGLSTTVTRRLDPATVDIALASDPAGRTLTADDRTAAAPFICTVIKGSQATVSAVPSETAGGRLFTFASWSDGGAASHTFTAAADTSLTATYTSASAPATPPGGTAQPATAPPAGKPAIRLGGTLHVSRRGVVSLRVRCPGPGNCRARLRLDTVAATSAAARRLAAALVKRIAAGRTTTVHVTLGPSTRRLVAARRTLKAIATVTVTPAGRPPVTSRTSYTLRAPGR